MSIRLFRVDERLIHGQVVIGWGRRLHPRRFVVVDDALAGSEWEQDLYRLAVEDEAEVEFLDVERARVRLPDFEADAVPTIVLTRDIGSMRRLGENDLLRGRSVNVGGLHPAAGRRKVRGWLNLGPEEEIDLRRMVEAGVVVEGRDLPDAPAVGVDEMLAS
jgi:PTS system mannose-specific IIB component/fructoselysine and glucoselysine-specific PTS system IIB component